MKGVILGIAPQARLVDITHDIPSYAIDEASFVLESAYRYFPPGTVHVVVVDPGVGSARRPIAAAARGHWFVAPDNGVLSPVLQSEPGSDMPEVYRISNADLFLQPVSRTFHGRDIFAPVAAHIARGMPPESIGFPISDAVRHDVPQPSRRGDRVAGVALRVDKYGNVITNLRACDLGEKFSIHVGGRRIDRLCASFSEAAPGELFAIEGSTGYVELALNQGSAADSLGIGRGAEIEVESAFSNH